MEFHEFKHAFEAIGLADEPKEKLAQSGLLSNEEIVEKLASKPNFLRKLLEEVDSQFSDPRQKRQQICFAIAFGGG